MIPVDYQELYDTEIARDCITHTHLPFLKDYIALHILLKISEPKSVLEVGTHIGEGTNIICNSVPKAKVFSLDLPPEEASKSMQHPTYKQMRIGEMCKRTYTQLYGDSMKFDYPICDAWFIDGEHDYSHPRHETVQAIKQKAKIIIWHDADIMEVYNAITDSFAYDGDYNLYRVTGTAIAYAVRKEK